MPLSLAHRVIVPIVASCSVCLAPQIIGAHNFKVLCDGAIERWLHRQDRRSSRSPGDAAQRVGTRRPTRQSLIPDTGLTSRGLGHATSGNGSYLCLLLSNPTGGYRPHFRHHRSTTGDEPPMSTCCLRECLSARPQPVWATGPKLSDLPVVSNCTGVRCPKNAHHISTDSATAGGPASLRRSTQSRTQAFLYQLIGRSVLLQRGPLDGLGSPDPGRSEMASAHPSVAAFSELCR